MEKFDPNGVGRKGSLFGLPFEPDQANLVVLPVPWEVTVSYGSGTARGPEAILEASAQIDLYQADIPEAWKYGLAMLPVDLSSMNDGAALREKAVAHISQLESGVPPSEEVLDTINRESERLNNWVYDKSVSWIKKGKTVAVLGGDHSSPLGLIRALSETHSQFSLLQIDAHADLRPAYEGFVYSHASIMHNSLLLPEVDRLVQVGIRDYCQQEAATISSSEGRIVTFLDQDIKERAYLNGSWHQLCDEIIDQLNDQVYISFDIDGLDPSLCPNTGTPVPGGLSFDQAMYLIKRLVLSGKSIIGFDLCEVAPGNSGDWDANVGARILYRLANLTGVSEKGLNLI